MTENDTKLKELINQVTDTLYSVENLFEGEKREKYIKDVEELNQKWLRENGLVSE